MVSTKWVQYVILPTIRHFSPKFTLIEVILIDLSHPVSGLRDVCGSLPDPIVFPNGCTPYQAYQIVENNSYMCSFFQCSNAFSIIGGGRTNIIGGGSSSWDGGDSGGSDPIECNCPVIPPCPPPTTTTIYKTKV